MIRTTEEMAGLVKQLRDAGATRIEVKPDGTVAAEFGPAIQVLPYPVPTSPWWPTWPTYPGIGPWWGTESPNVYYGDLICESASTFGPGGFDANH